MWGRGEVTPLRALSWAQDGGNIKRGFWRAELARCRVRLGLGEVAVEVTGRGRGGGVGRRGCRGCGREVGWRDILRAGAPGHNRGHF